MIGGFQVGAFQPAYQQVPVATSWDTTQGRAGEYAKRFKRIQDVRQEAYGAGVVSGADIAAIAADALAASSCEGVLAYATVLGTGQISTQVRVHPTVVVLPGAVGLSARAQRGAVFASAAVSVTVGATSATGGWLTVDAEAGTVAAGGNPFITGGTVVTPLGVRNPTDEQMVDMALSMLRKRLH